MVRYHIVFHDDIDGIVSAAIFLRHTVKGSSYRLYPVASSQRGRLGKLVDSMGLETNDFLAILDYEFHPMANLWVDHHFNRTIGPLPVINDKVMYNPTYASAARLLYDNLLTKQTYPNAFLKHVDMIDSAGYPTVQYAFTNNHPLMMLRAYLEINRKTEHLLCRVVETIAKTCFDLPDAMFRVCIDYRSVKSMSDLAVKSKKFTTVFQNTSLIMQKRPEQFPRYSEFLNLSSIQYTIRISPIDGQTSIVQIGYNNWHKKKNSLNIGEFCHNSIYLKSGGGHYNVGGGQIKKDNIGSFIESSIITFNGEGSMEKYGVDKEDPIEQKAAGLVKTGSAGDIEKAREQVTEKETDIDGGPGSTDSAGGNCEQA